MRLFALLSCLIPFIGIAIASVEAGPYQTIWLWYAYRIDGMRDPAKMAIHCTGTGPNGRCKFDEFLRWADTYPWEGSTSVRDSLDPDMKTTVEELQAMAKGRKGDRKAYRAKPDPEKFFPGQGVPASLYEFHSKLIGVVQDARSELGDKRLAPQLSIVDTLWNNIHSMRLYENADPMLKTYKFLITQRFPAIKDDKIPVIKHEPLPEKKYWEVDTKALLEMPEIKNGKAENIKLVQDFVEDYRAGKTDKLPKGKAGKGHWEAIQACVQLKTRLKNGPGC